MLEVCDWVMINVMFDSASTNFAVFDHSLWASGTHTRMCAVAALLRRQY